jgi:small-conductance mechanosensitive channel
MDAQQKIYLEILQAFEKENIEFAYPTQTLFAANAFVNKAEEKTNGIESSTVERN